jgi:hypothetical protein
MSSSEADVYVDFHNDLERVKWLARRLLALVLVLALVVEEREVHFPYTTGF